MSNPALILDRCRKLGLRVWVDGDRLGVAPKERIPPGLLDEIRDAKSALLPLLADGVGLQADCIPWLHVAHQINCGEFDGCDRSTRESLTFGLRKIAHPACLAALQRLNP